MTYFVDEIRRIVGNEDGSGGEPGQIQFEGKLADRFVAALGRSDNYLGGHPVRITRMLAGVEIWINGFYIEGSGVRKITARALQGL